MAQAVVSEKSKEDVPSGLENAKLEGVVEEPRENNAEDFKADDVDEEFLDATENEDSVSKVKQLIGLDTINSTSSHSR